MDGDNSSIVSHESGASGSSLCTLSVLTRTILTDATTTNGINNIPFHSQHDSPPRNGVVTPVPESPSGSNTSSANKHPPDKNKAKTSNGFATTTNGQLLLKANGAPPPLVNGFAGDGGNTRSATKAKTPDDSGTSSSRSSISGAGINNGSVAVAIKNNSLSSLLSNGHHHLTEQVDQEKKGSSVTELLNTGSNHIGNGPRNECENESETPGSSTGGGGRGDAGHNSAIDEGPGEQGKGKSPVLTGYLGSWKRSRYLSGNFSVSGDTMEGIVQCLVFLKAFSVKYFYSHHFLLVLTNEMIAVICILISPNYCDSFHLFIRIIVIFIVLNSKTFVAVHN